MISRISHRIHSEIFLGDRFKGGVPNNTKSPFLTHRTTHSAKISFLKVRYKVNFGGFWGSNYKNFRNFQIFLKRPVWSFIGDSIKILQNISI